MLYRINYFNLSFFCAHTEINQSIDRSINRQLGAQVELQMANNRVEELRKTLHETRSFIKHKSAKGAAMAAPA